VHAENQNSRHSSAGPPELYTNPLAIHVSLSDPLGKGRCPSIMKFVRRWRVHSPACTRWRHTQTDIITEIGMNGIFCRNKGTLDLWQEMAAGTENGSGYRNLWPSPRSTSATDPKKPTGPHNQGNGVLMSYLISREQSTATASSQSRLRCQLQPQCFCSVTPLGRIGGRRTHHGFDGR
jgi:hypothetical protein